MPPKIKHFPSGKWRVLFGGYVQLGTAPNPEYTYRVPLAKITEGGPSSALSFMYAKAGLGELPSITPGTVFEDGIRFEADPHQSFVLNVNTGKEADKQERTLGQFLDAFTAEDDPFGYIESLRLAAKSLKSLADAPVVVFKATTLDCWVVASSAEWYRRVYGRSPYLAHTFLMPTFQDVEDRLVVSDRTGMVPRKEVHHPLLPEVEEVLAVVPRTNVPNLFVPLYTSIKLGSELHGDLAQRNSLYAAQSIRASGSDGCSRLRWLRFGHPYPDRDLLVKGRGICGTLEARDGRSDDMLQAIFLTSIENHPHPDGLPCCILERENDGNSIEEIGGDKPLPCDESEIQMIPRFEAVADGDQEATTVTPDANPRAGQVAAKYEGAIIDDTGAPPIVKLKRKGQPDPSLIRRVQKRDYIIDSGERTTNQIESKNGEAGPASFESKIDLEAEESDSLFALMNTINRFEADGTIQDVRPVNYFPSVFSIGGMSLQQFPPSIGSERWLQMQDRHRKRLILAVRFEYRSSLFVILDLERKASESFSFLLARCAPGESIDAIALNANVQAAVEKLHEAKGILGNARIEEGFFGVQSLKHQKEVHESIVRVRCSYVLGKLDSLISAVI